MPFKNRKTDVSAFLDVGDAPSNKKANITVNSDGSMILGVNASFKAYSGLDKDTLINPIGSDSLAGQMVVFCNSTAGINNLSQGEIGVLMVTPGSVAKGDEITDDFTVIGGSGGNIYDSETDYDLTSSSQSLDLTTFFAQDDGYIQSWSWHSGDGTYTIDWDSGTYTGKTIGGVTANTLTTDLKGEGKGRLTLRKEGNDARILYYSDHDGGQFTSTNASSVNAGFQKDAHGCMRVFSVTEDSRACTTASGALYRGAQIVAEAYVLPLKTIEFASIDIIECGDIVRWIVKGSSTTSKLTHFCDYYIIDTGNSSAKDTTVSLNARGRWTTSYPIIG